MSIAEESLGFMGLFEAEVLVELMLRYWNHPFANDQEFRNNLIEEAAEVLRTSIAGIELIESLPPKSMNLVAAVWYAEFSQVDGTSEQEDPDLAQRKDWLTSVQRSLPSCFCSPDRLR